MADKCWINTRHNLVLRNTEKVSDTVPSSTGAPKAWMVSGVMGTPREELPSAEWWRNPPMCSVLCGWKPCLVPPLCDGCVSSAHLYPLWAGSASGSTSGKWGPQLFSSSSCCSDSGEEGGLRLHPQFLCIEHAHALEDEVVSLLFPDQKCIQLNELPACFVFILGMSMFAPPL